MSLSPTATAPSEHMVAVRYEHTSNFVEILEELGISLLVSTYQAGKLVTVGTYGGKIDIAFTNFEQAMGIAVRPDRIALGAKRQVWLLRPARDIAAHVAPSGKYDTCWLTRSSLFTGAIHAHELAWSGEELWLVNTLFSCLCTVNDEYSFIPRWRPRFVTAFASEDRCHLNGLAMDDGKPKYVTCLAESDTAGGWRPTKATSGCIIEVPTNEVIARGFAMPHSPRLVDGQLFVLDSGHGRLSRVDPKSGKSEPVVHLLGYTRGLTIAGHRAFVGLSKIRETSVFGGIPIAEQRDKLQCGVAIIDLRTGKQEAILAFHSGVDEIFAIDALPCRLPVFSGPLPEQDGTQTMWLAPAPKE